MNLHPAYEVLRRHGIRFVTNSDGTFRSNCPNPKCRKENNFVHYDDDEVGWHCHDCGESRIVHLRPASARAAAGDGRTPKVDGGTPRDDDEKRALEEALREFDGIEDEDEPAAGNSQGGAVEEPQQGKSDQRKDARGNGAGQETSGTTGQAGQAGKQRPSAQTGEVTLDDFIAYLQQHNYIFTPTREPWPAAGVNARIKPEPLVDVDGKPLLDKDGKPKFIAASTWLDQNRPVEQMTWLPGEPMLIKDRLITDDGPIERVGVTTFNLYRPPTLIRRRGNIALWRDHLHRIYPDEADHIEMWCAQRVQRPQEKINHALVFGGEQGIGKDSMLEPVKRAVGRSNVEEVTPKQVLGRFSGFLRSVILRVNEARDLGDYGRFAFYDHMKGIIAAPPDVLRVDEKNLREYRVINCVGVVITTNYKTDGIFLPAGDRRHHVAWSECKEKDFDPEYWIKLWRYYDNGGDANVANYLAELDISTFDPKAPPPKTAAFWDIVDANRAPEDAELADALDKLRNPKATTLSLVQVMATPDFAIWLADRKNRRQIPHRFEKCGYVRVHSDLADDGLWVINKKRQAVYAKAELDLRERIAEALKLTGNIEDFE